MIDDQLTLATLDRYLDALPSTAPDRVLTAALERIGSTKQQRRSFQWLPFSPLAFAGATAAVLVLGVVIGVLLGSRLSGPTPAVSIPPVVASPSPPARPSATPPEAAATVVPQPAATASTVGSQEFEFPFTYSVPAGLELITSIDSEKLVVLNTNATGGVPLLYDIDTHGIIIASPSEGYSDTCPRAGISSVPIRPGADMLDVLDRDSGLSVTPTAMVNDVISRVTVDLVEMEPPCLDHLHLLGGESMQLMRGSTRLYMKLFGGATVVFFQVWSGRPTGGEAWFEIAEDIIGSITFGAAATPSAQPTSAPSGSSDVRQATEFQVPFSYELSANDRLAQNLRSSGVPDHSGSLFGFEEAVTGDSAPRYGIAVALVTNAGVHRCPRSSTSSEDVSVRTSPRDLLDDMQQLGGMEFADPVEGLFDGRPALFTERVAGAHECEVADLHFGGSTGRSSLAPFLPLDTAGSSILLEVDGETVLIDVWAETDEELADWLPLAMEFVNSIHFV